MPKVPPPRPFQRLLTRAECAAYLHVSEEWVKRSTLRRTLPSVKVGGSIRYDLKDLDEYIAAGRREVVPQD